MKRCPKCQQEYHDDSLEFCLEDGARLISPIFNKTSEETVVLTNIQNQPTIPILSKTNLEGAKSTKVEELKVKAVDKGYKILEIAPIIFALIHNYWQWLYAEKQPFSSISEFFLSANFIVWLFLLTSSTGLSFSALKFGRNKGFAITSLIILAINFLLFVVPRR